MVASCLINIFAINFLTCLFLFPSVLLFVCMYFVCVCKILNPACLKKQWCKSEVYERCCVQNDVEFIIVMSISQLNVVATSAL